MTEPHDRALTYKEVDNLLIYNEDTGIFTWKKRGIEFFNSVENSHRICLSWNKKHSGRPAGTISENGYIIIKINGVRYNAHRIAWIFISGHPTDKFIDHIDMNKLNNKKNNLREATKSENGYNRPALPNNKLGLKGVTFVKKENCFRASITVHGNTIKIGSFKTADQASEAYKIAALKHHGEFARVS